MADRTTFDVIEGGKGDAWEASVVLRFDGDHVVDIEPQSNGIVAVVDLVSVVAFRAIRFLSEQPDESEPPDLEPLK